MRSRSARTPGDRGEKPAPNKVRKTPYRGKQWVEQAAKGFSERIKAAAELIGGQAALAEKLGVTRQSVSSWTKQNGSTPGGMKLLEIIAATGCDAAWLLTGEGDIHGAAGP